MDQTDWAAVELCGAILRLWRFKGTNPGPEVVAPLGTDPQAALDGLLDMGGDTGRVTVIAAGWPGVAPAPVPCPPPAPLTAPILTARTALHPLPGLRQSRPCDLAGGATVRIAGHLAANPGFDGILCLPEDPSVWVHVSAGEIVSFRSFLTAELLRGLIAAPDPAAVLGQGFAQAVQDCMSRPAAVAAGLSSVRAQQALGVIDEVEAQAQMAGLLLGAELAAARPWWLGQPVTILGEGWLASFYDLALRLQGLQPDRADPALASVNGFRAARAKL